MTDVHMRPVARTGSQWPKASGTLAAGGTLAALVVVGLRPDVMAPAALAVFYAMPVAAWILLARAREAAIPVGIVLVTMAAGALTASWWPPGDWTVPVRWHIALAYPILAGVVVVAAGPAETVERGERGEQGGRGETSVRPALAYSLLGLHVVPVLLVGLVLAAGGGDLRTSTPGPHPPARGELMPLPSGLVVLSERRGGGSQVDTLTFDIAAPDGAPPGQVLARVRDHLEGVKGWRLEPAGDRAIEINCRPLTLYLAIVGRICVDGRVGPGSDVLSVTFSASIL
jgi:hypothetical protein